MATGKAVAANTDHVGNSKCCNQTNQCGYNTACDTHSICIGEEILSTVKDVDQHVGRHCDCQYRIDGLEIATNAVVAVEAVKGVTHSRA